MQYQKSYLDIIRCIVEQLRAAYSIAEPHERDEIRCRLENREKELFLLELNHLFEQNFTISSDLAIHRKFEAIKILIEH